MCLHDLLWFMVACLSPMPVDADEEESSQDANAAGPANNKKKERREPEQVDNKYIIL